MATNTAEALRAARKARLAASDKPEEKSTAPAAQSDSSTSKEASKEPVVEPAKAPEPAPAPEPVELVAQIVDPARLANDATISITGPYNAQTDNPHWLVCANGEPMAKIALADQEDPDSIRKIFATEDFAKSFQQTVKRVPVLQVLQTVRARPYVASVKSTEVFEALDKKYQEEAKVAFQKKATRYRDDLSSTLMLVAEARRKNFITLNPLKDALFQHMKRAGVQDPVRVIESAFQEASSSDFEAMLKQAEKWMDLSAEALAEIKQSITEMPARDIQAIAIPPGMRVSSADPRRPVPSADANVPVRSVGTGEEPQEKVAAAEKEKVKGTFSFRSRMHNHKMAVKP